MKPKSLLASLLISFAGSAGSAATAAQSGAAATNPVGGINVIAVPAKTTSHALSRQRTAIERKLRADARPVFPTGEARALEKLGDGSLGQTLKLHFASDEALAKFKSWARSNAPLFRIEANPVAKTTQAATPSDAPAPQSLRDLQWGLKNSGGTYSVEVDDFTTKTLPSVAGEDSDIDGAPAATKPVIVAVLDSGVDINHPGLKGAIATHDSECAALKQYQSCVARQGAAKCANLLVDTDGNGYPLDCNGWNLAAEDDGQGMSVAGPLPQTAGILGNGHVADYIGHGTHVAGIIAAQINGNGGATEGIAPNAKILPVRVISGEPNEQIRAQEVSGDLPAPQEAELKAGRGLGDIVARGVLYAVRSGAQVINMSLGWPDPLDSELLRRIIAVARSQGTLLVAASGNDSTDHVIYPCRYDGVVCVGAYGPDGALAFFSNYGHGVDILAPGWNILSTFPMGLLPLHFTDQVGYESKDGTSMAAPFVSGMLARMIGAGMSADEAYARLILGARPTRPSQVEAPALFADASLSGNADLGASFRVAPQALILHSRKESVRIEWDRASNRVPMTFYLQNHWIDAKNVKVTIQSEPSAGGVRLTKSTWSIASWKALQEKGFPLRIALPDSRVDSDLDFRVRVTASNAAAREFVIRAEIVAPIGIDSAPGENLKVISIVSPEGDSASRSYDEVRTVLGDTATREYLGIRSDASGKTLELLVEENLRAGGSQMKVQGTLSLPKSGNQIRSLEKVVDPKTGNPAYVLIEMLPPPKARQVGSSQVTWLDTALRPRADRPSQTVDITTTYLSEDFQWQRRSGDLVPTWYALGKAPASERKPFDPWNPTDGDRATFMMFMLASDGLHSIQLPKDYPILISLLPQTPDQRRNGIVSVLLAKGNDYALEYATAELAEGAWRSFQPITLATYHNLRGIVASPVFSLDANSSYAGTAFPGYVDSDVGPKGSRRTTVVSSSGSLDFSAYPLRNFDAVTDVTGTFLGASTQAQFTLTKYQVQYHDYAQRKSVMRSQNRFSFLPAIFSIKSFFPAIAADSRGRIPALFVPGDFIFSKATQVIMPAYDSSGVLNGLVRPAKLHLESKPGCTALPSAKPADAAGPAELVFFCGDRFLSVPMSF